MLEQEIPLICFVSRAFFSRWPLSSRRYAAASRASRRARRSSGQEYFEARSGPKGENERAEERREQARSRLEE